MTPSEIGTYILARNGELSSDEILVVTDVSRNKDIDHIIYDSGIYQMWSKDGMHFTFRKRNW